MPRNDESVKNQFDTIECCIEGLHYNQTLLEHDDSVIMNYTDTKRTKHCHTMNTGILKTKGKCI